MRKKLLELRANKKLTQGEVAEKIGISRTHYARIESGERNPSFQIALKIKNFYQYYDDDLFFVNQ
jgi:putative transcriptional regulator